MHPTLDDLQSFLAQARPRPLRTMRAFAEAEIIIPDGPFAGRRFRCSRQPYTGLWFDAVDSGQWSRCVATGPTQSGKTLSCFVVPLLYHLFELQETVICGLPDMDMAGDKWREDILPAIERSRYRDLLPRRGGGSRGGRVESLQFANGATLKFMSGGGGDKSRAGFTSRVVVITETDGMDQAAASSRESDKITQLEARTRAYGNRKRIYMECTVSTEQGRTWQEYKSGTQSRIALPCPYCPAWVSPEREHLTGWQGATGQAEARRVGAFSCPNCGQLWSDADRENANHRGRLLHAGQSIDGEGEVEGLPPQTDTLGFRWSAVNNLFLTAGDFAADEWRAAHAPDEDNADREMRQFVWCVPVAPSKWAETSLEVHELAERMIALPKGVAPPETKFITAAVDLGKYLIHWIVVAWRMNATGHIVDYGRIEVASEDVGVEQGVMLALREFHDMATTGWPVGHAEGKTMVPQQVWIDAGYQGPVVYAFCRQVGDRFRPAVGRGAAQQYRQWYNRPTSTGNVVKVLGEGYHANLLTAEGLLLVEVDADQWKSWVHARLSTPIDRPGAMTLYRGTPKDHIALAKHLTAETKTEQFVAGKGVVAKWERLRRQNHWFDALYNACAAAHACGARLVEPDVERRQEPEDYVEVGSAFGPTITERISQAYDRFTDILHRNRQ
ncbi:MAG: phage terminase large subunit family protein [Phycisphaerae bacterium]|nr:phage terminase large subunit family protein [Phycisphaerae bacterium]